MPPGFLFLSALFSARIASEAWSKRPTSKPSRSRRPAERSSAGLPVNF